MVSQTCPSFYIIQLWISGRATAGRLLKHFDVFLVRGLVQKDVRLDRKLKANEHYKLMRLTSPPSPTLRCNDTSAPPHKQFAVSAYDRQRDEDFTIRKKATSLGRSYECRLWLKRSSHQESI